MTARLSCNTDDYNAMVKDTFAEITRLAKEKGAEYSGDINRLENFVRNGERLNIEPELVWAIYAAKHWDAIMQYVMDTQEGRERIRSEPITGRIDDLIVYLLLAKAMYAARHMSFAADPTKP